MREILEADRIGDKRDPGLDHPLGAAHHLFYEPGAGGAPHPFYLVGELEGGRTGRQTCRDITRRCSRRADDACVQAGPVEFGLLKGFRQCARCGGEEEKDLAASMAAEAGRIAACLPGGA